MQKAISRAETVSELIKQTGLEKDCCHVDCCQTTRDDGDDSFGGGIRSWHRHRLV